MTIRTKLFLSVALVIILSLILGSIIFFSTARIDKTVEKGQKSDRIVREIFQLTLLLNDYLMYHEERSAKQWQIKHKAIGNLLASQHYNDPKDQAIHEDIIKTHASAAEDFTQLINAYPDNTSEDLRVRLTSLLLVKSQAMVSKSVVLSEKSFSEQRQTRENAVLVLGVVIGILLISTITLFFLLYKSIVDPIAKLNKGTRLIASGNWSHKVDVNSHDEIGQLAQAFNTMSAKINSYITELKQLEKQKDDFIAAASHELKTPLTSLSIYYKSLHNKLEKTKDTKTENLLEKIDGQLKRLLNMVDDLLDVQKIVGGKLQYTFEYFDLKELVNEIIQETRLTTENRHIIKRLTKSTTVYGSRAHIEQVLTNFISNAIKYSPKKEKIVVSTEISETNIILSVRDFGIGIAKKDQEKVFERFYRAGGKIEKTYPGIGLGLYISSQIIKHHGGKIWVKSQKNKGSIFSFALPIKETKQT